MTDNPVYLERVVAFIDVIGFKNLIELSAKDNSKAEDIRELLSFIKSEKDGEGFRQVSVFSDCITISYPLEAIHKPTHHEPKLIVNEPMLLIMGDIWSLTQKFLEQGVIVRGAIVQGKLYHVNDIVFGPAFVKAYILGDKTNKFPRVIVDQSCYDFVSPQAEHNSHLSDDNPILQMIKYPFTMFQYVASDDNNDGKHFINFLSLRAANEKDAHLKILQQSRDIITASISDKTLSKKEKKKWIWFKEYFNDVINSSSHHGLDIIQ